MTRPDRTNEVRAAVHAALARGKALEAREVRELRARSRKAILIYKSIFWAGIAVFNLAMFVPLPFPTNRTLLHLVAALSLVAAIVVPLVGLKRHQLSIELLKVSRQQPVKKNAGEQGRAYIEQVRKQGRPYINAEIELIDGVPLRNGGPPPAV